ncbi:unnamed protein product, partial [marine sediment metagenome]
PGPLLDYSLMKLIKRVKEMQGLAKEAQRAGKSIGLVPTMGALHKGHLSLVEAAKKKAEVVVVSIFVNPTQFGLHEDLSRYPKSLSLDKKLLNNFEVDALFLPDALEMYPPEYKTYVEVQGLSDIMCGRFRPHHFRGVTSIVAKLFNIVSPHFAFFGEKDFQQQVIIKSMAKDLNFPIEIITLPTVREFDGLAMSSRNRYLKEKERKAALILYQTLLLGKSLIKEGEKNANKILQRMRAKIKS